MFLEKGKTIYSLEGKDSTDVYVDETDEKRDYPVMILMNDGTASASEVLAAALKESYGATLLGTTSYGKGKSQRCLCGNGNAGLREFRCRYSICWN